VTSDPVPGPNGSPPPDGQQPSGYDPTAEMPAAQPPGRLPAYGQQGYPPPSYGPPPYPPPPTGYSQQAPGFVQPGMLAAAADRERTMDVLKAAFGEGRLTKDEFEARAARAMTARTYGELSAVVADLPAGPGPVASFPPGYYPPAVRTPTNGAAIGALACGIAEFFTLGLAAIPAVILGHMARGQIKRTGERGDGMAIAGLVLGYLGIIGWVLLILGLAVTTGSSGPAGPAGP
jgi:hypothetical protein